MAKRSRRNPIETLSESVLLCNRSELDLFTPPKEKDEVLSVQEIMYIPFSSMDNDGPVTFCVPAVEEFTDLSKTTLTLKVKIQKSNGESIETWAAVQGRGSQGNNDSTSSSRANPRYPDVSVPCDFFDCLALKIGLEINSMRVGSDHYHHPQVSVLKNVLSYPEAVGDANLKHSIIWLTDDGEDYRESKNKDRYRFVAGSKEVTLISRLSHDAFNSVRLLPPGNSLKIRIDRASPEFALIRAKDSTTIYKIKWLDARLSVFRITPTIQTIQSTARQITGGKPVYLPFVRTDARSFEIPVGTRHYRAQALFSGILPDRALLVFVEPDSLGSGEYTNNPVVFPASKFDVSEIQFFIDERSVLPTAYKPDWKNKEYLEEYQGLLAVMNLDRSLTGSCITYGLFGRDYGIFAVRLRGFEGKQQGVISVEVRFQKATSQPISGLLVPEFRSCVMIDSDKNVSQADY